jgi:uncharacterized PurR-regulated membrane protein YhhQ (DUF165 family)
MTRLLVLGYLVAITAANLITAHFAQRGHPEVSIYTAFGLVAFDFVARDRLHDAWGPRRWPYLGLLILAGSAVSYAITRDAATAQIAIASCAAFAAALTVDSVVYELAARAGWQWLERSNASNIAGATVDSVVFVAVAFPGFLFAVAFGQFAAKVAGGLIFSLVLSRRVAWAS